MKTFGKIICLCGILIFKLTVCSAADGLSEDDLKKIYKLDATKGGTVNANNYKIIKGEITNEPSKKIWMKMESAVESSKITGLMHKLSTSKGSGSKKKAEAKPEESYVSNEIEVFTNLKKGKKDLLSEYIVDMLNHGTYDSKKVLIISGLGKNLKEHSSKPYSWDDLSKIAPCMIKALRLLHGRNYVHRNLKPESFAFGTEGKVAPLKNWVYLFDVGLAQKYKHSNGSHKASEQINEFGGETTYASMAAMNNKTQNRRDDIESLYFVLAYVAGFTSPFEKKKFKDLYEQKEQFSGNKLYLKELYGKSKTIKDVRIFNAFMDCAFDLDDLFDADHTVEPEYDYFISCFDQGLSEAEIKERYNFVNLNKFNEGGSVSFIGKGNRTDPKNKFEVVMKFQKPEKTDYLELASCKSYRDEIRVYKHLKKGLNHSLLRENICDMLDHGIYNNRRAIIMSHLGTHFSNDRVSYTELCKFARQAIRALRFLHKKGYIHQDVKPDNFAFGSVELKKDSKSQGDIPLKTQLYLFDFGNAEKWTLANNTHKPRIKLKDYVGSPQFIGRTGILKYLQSRRDDMESLLFTLATVVARRPILSALANNPTEMWEERNKFATLHFLICKKFNLYGLYDEDIEKAFEKYVNELKKLFVSDEPKYFEMEPNYNAFCVCFGGKPGNNACDDE